ncbi:hypothetical protein M758_UG323400 [Ceratodon purpureus]|nr:hypothetical protein M758_UG323400 [Ceratodon purpureus]
MAAAMQLTMSASSFFCPTAVASKQVGSSSTQSFATPTTLVICQQDKTEHQTINVSRRNLSNGIDRTIQSLAEGKR